MSLYFLRVMSDCLIICLIDFPLRSRWWMVIFVQSAVIRFHGSRCIKTVMTERREIFPPFSFFSALLFFWGGFFWAVPASRHLTPTSSQCSVCAAVLPSWFGHWFLLEYISVWFKFSWEMHDPPTACRHCLASTGILPASRFHCLCLSNCILLILFLSLLPFSSFKIFLLFTAVGKMIESRMMGSKRERGSRSGVDLDYVFLNIFVLSFTIMVLKQLNPGP